MPVPASDDRVELARRIIDYGTTPIDLGPRPRGREAMAIPRAALALDWPAGLEPTAEEIVPEPATSDPLPGADYLVVTWTAAECEALADVLTPGVPRARWYRYDRKFEEYLPKIRKGAPSRMANRLGSWFPTMIGDRKAICFKSELHLNQDGVRTGAGRATLPVADLFEQLMDEVRPKLVITVGTAGATFPDHELGDVVVTRAAKFRVTKEFANEPFAGKTFKCDMVVPDEHLGTAKMLMKSHAARLEEPACGPPTKRYVLAGGGEPPLVPGVANDPDIKIDGRDFKAFHPMLTTDFFEFGNSANRLHRQGCGVEMGDAALGLVAKRLGAAAPNWLVIRNISDPLINADLPTEPVDMQVHWAVWYYESYGYWTSVNSAIVTWAMIAG